MHPHLDRGVNALVIFGRAKIEQKTTKRGEQHRCLDPCIAFRRPRALESDTDEIEPAFDRAREEIGKALAVLQREAVHFEEEPKEWEGLRGCHGAPDVAAHVARRRGFLRANRFEQCALVIAGAPKHGHGQFFLRR